MEEQDFLSKKYEYDSIQKLNLEILLKEENNKFLREKESINKKNKNFEKVKQEFIEAKGLESKDLKNNLEFLQKRIIDKSKDLERQHKILTELSAKKEKLFIEFNKSNKSLEMIYKKIEDFTLNKKIQNENISESETVENLLHAKCVKKEDEAVSSISDKKDSLDVLQQGVSYKKTDNETTINENSFQSNFCFNNESGERKQKECYMSFDEFKERVDSFKTKNTDDLKSLMLEYKSKSGATYSIDLYENINLIDINISINSYRDYLNLKNEKEQIISSLKENGINIRNIHLKQKGLV